MSGPAALCRLLLKGAKTLLNDVIILAAGKGERLKPLTNTCHKALLPISGGHTLGRCLKAFSDAKRLVVNVHYLAEQVSHAVLSVRPDAVISFERILLDSGGGVRHVLGFFDQPFWVMNSDIAGDLGVMRKTLEASWRGHEGMRLLVIPTPPDQPGDYDMDELGRLSSRRGGSFTVAGLHIAQPHVYLSYPDGMIFSNRNVWDDLEKLGQLYGTVFHGDWLDIGTHERLNQVGYITKD